MKQNSKRIIIIGAMTLIPLFIAGIILSWHNIRVANIESEFLARITVVPLFIMFMLFFITIPTLIVSVVLICIAFLKQKIWWLSIIGFVIIGLYWLIILRLSSMIPLD